MHDVLSQRPEITASLFNLYVALQHSTAFVMELRKHLPHLNRIRSQLTLSEHVVWAGSTILEFCMSLEGGAPFPKSYASRSCHT